MVLFSLGACAPTYRHGSQEELAKSLFTAFQRNDTVGLKKLVPSRADAEEMIMEPGTPEEEKAALRLEMDAMVEEFQDLAIKAFIVVRHDATADGVDWKKAKFSQMVLEDCRTEDVEICDVILHFESNGKRWEVFIDNAGKCASGWVIGYDAIQWMGEI